MIKFELQKCTLRLSSVGRLISLLMLFCSVVASAADLPITEDFGPYSRDTEKQLRQNLIQLGDMTDSTADLNTGIDKFYQRTGLTYSADLIQQILDTEFVQSAESEAARVTGNDVSAATGQTLDYANNIAPWLSKPAVVAVEPPPVDPMLQEQSVLENAMAKIEMTLESIDGTVELMY